MAASAGKYLELSNMSGYSPAIMPLQPPDPLEERVSELEQKVDVIGEILSSIAKFLGFRKPKC